MKFFIPAAEDDAQAERVYSAIREFNGTTYPLTDRRIFSMVYVHEGKTFYAKVGEPETRTRALVVAILESERLYYVCTGNRGVIRGELIFVGVNEVQDLELFD
jgi:hypothetical protein